MFKIIIINWYLIQTWSDKASKGCESALSSLNRGVTWNKANNPFQQLLK